MLLDQRIVYSLLGEQVYIILRNYTPRIDGGMHLENVTNQCVDFVRIDSCVLIGHLHIDIIDNNLNQTTPFRQRLQTWQLASLS